MFREAFFQKTLIDVKAATFLFGWNARVHDLTGFDVPDTGEPFDCGMYLVFSEGFWIPLFA